MDGWLVVGIRVLIIQERCRKLKRLDRIVVRYTFCALIVIVDLQYVSFYSCVIFH